MKRDIKSKETSVSIVIPVYNEKEALQQLRERLLETIESWRNSGWNFAVEILLIDDGSIDGSNEIMDKFAEEDPHFKIIHLSRNAPINSGGSCKSASRTATQSPLENAKPADNAS